MAIILPSSDQCRVGTSHYSEPLTRFLQFEGIHSILDNELAVLLSLEPLLANNSLGVASFGIGWYRSYRMNWYRLVLAWPVPRVLRGTAPVVP